MAICTPHARFATERHRSKLISNLLSSMVPRNKYFFSHQFASERKITSADRQILNAVPKKKAVQ